MTGDDVSLCWEALENVPRLPSYATRAIERLKAELRAAREQEAKYRSAIDTVKTSVAEVAPWDGAPNLS